VGSQTASNDYVRRFAGGAEDPLGTAHERALDAGARATAPEAGALLRWFAAQGPARSAVEIGATGGTSGLWLLGGMAERATLTSIESDPDRQDLARRAFQAGGVADHVRSIVGNPAQVLPRLADASYDLALLNDDLVGWPEYLPHLQRMLRPGGVMLAVGALCDGQVADPAVTEDAVTAVRAFNATVRDEESWQAVLLPDAGGLLLARLVRA
jgi:predicted O-methyltransferase YrrM